VQVHLVGRGCRLPAERRHRLDLRPGHRQAVERIAMLVGQLVDVQGMAQRDRQHREAVAADLVVDEKPGRPPADRGGQREP